MQRHVASLPLVAGKRAASPQLPSASNGKIFPTDADRTKVPGGYRPSRLATGGRMERSDHEASACRGSQSPKKG
ncbi:MAG: hypothetical protein LBQ54_08505 [Planctomycetaceae bacterium]|nr:hypothetical protein [Planctomycetaceae bacterium]